MESFIIYFITFFVSTLIIWVYVKKMKKLSDSNSKKIEKAKEEGAYEPVSLYPYIDEDNCIKSGACVIACPEKEIIGIRNGRATLINASRCIGHGACFHACPVEAIALKIGTEKRGVDLPHVSQNFETNVKGIFIAGELGGMGLIKNSVEQGKQAVENIFASVEKNHGATYDLVIIGAGPAGISASLQAKKLGLKAITLEQDTLGGTVYNFPRAKIVMTSPMDLPGYGKVKLFQTSKTELLKLWNAVLTSNDIKIQENQKVELIGKEDSNFSITTLRGDTFKTNRILLAIGRRGSPRKLNVDGEKLEKVYYKLLEPERYQGKDILVVGGGDSAIESALLLADENKVTLTYRSEKFNRLKPLNSQKINQAIDDKKILVLYSSNVLKIEEAQVVLQLDDLSEKTLKNDFVFIFAGGELPTQFLEKSGIQISKRFNYTMKSHK
ncbi:MAG: NAD(P)-binding domain-containing protein [Saprospiraceae bacterium]|nr:NAD(P)-binding domain-containing protein [Saprospiraceae bacterium]MBK8819641.1 NAD(P)-binding domain-containing protein [Saprospiraceae bacterium]